MALTDRNWSPEYPADNGAASAARSLAAVAVEAAGRALREDAAVWPTARL